MNCAPSSATTTEEEPTGTAVPASVATVASLVHLFLQDWNPAAARFAD